MNEPVLERIARALERIAALHGAPVAYEEDPAEAVDISQILDKSPLTNEELKSVTTFFKESGNLEIVKETAIEVGVVKLSDLVTREQQDKFLTLLKSKAVLLAPVQQKNVIAVITKLQGE